MTGDKGDKHQVGTLADRNRWEQRPWQYLTIFGHCRATFELNYPDWDCWDNWCFDGGKEDDDDACQEMSLTL